MSKKTEDRQWVAESGSIYVAEYDTMRSEFPGQKTSIPVRVAVAFNVGETLANHIVETHNARLKWEQDNPVRTYINGSAVDDTNRGTK